MACLKKKNKKLKLNVNEREENVTTKNTYLSASLINIAM